MQAWLIARDEPNLPALLEQAHYEGAPPLWSLMLRPLTFLTHRPEAMQVFNGALAGITLFVFAWFAPFSRVLKTFFVCNYYLMYEYGIVCRNYLPAILCLAVACILYRSARGRPWPFVISLIVAAFASVHSLIVAVAMGAAMLGSWLFDALKGGEKQEAGAVRFRVLPWLGFALGVGLAVYSMLPRLDTFYDGAAFWRFDWDPARLGRVSWAFVYTHFPLPWPAPILGTLPWDMFVPPFGRALVFAFSLAIFFGAIFFLRRDAGALLFYLMGTLGVFAFLYVKYLGFSRHTGFLFLTFLFALWVNRAGGPPREGRLAMWTGRAEEIVLGLMLAFQAFTGLYAVKTDFYMPFSCGKQAAQIISEHHLQNAFTAVDPDWLGSPLAGYLDRSFYYPDEQRYGSFTHWDTRRVGGIGDEISLWRATNEAKGREMVFVVGHPLADDFMKAHGIENLAQVTGSQSLFEDYYLYFVPRQAGTAGSAR